MNILLIEDEHKIVQAIKKSLEQVNYAVDVSYDGDEGYKMATTKSYDLAIIDRMVPGEYNGIAIVKAMRKAKNHTPVIILTAKNTIAERTAGLDSGADDVLVKPFALDDLLSKVRFLLRDPSQPEQTILSIADLTLDTVSFAVKRGKTNIHLTGKEFALMAFLLRNQGRPSNKDTIISHVWDYNAEVLPNTVEVYMKYLRQKIDDPFKVKLLHTSRGFGYQIEVK